MPGAGTDKTKRWIETPAPVVDPGRAAARREHRHCRARDGAISALSRLRLVKPRDGWPNDKARAMAAGADRVLDDATLFDSLERRDRRLHLRARHHRARARPGQARGRPRRRPRARSRRESRPARPSRSCSAASATGSRIDEVALADRIVTLPVNPAFASLNLAQAVVIVAYEWFKLASGGALPFAMPQKSPPAPQAAAAGFLRRSRARAGAGRILPPAGEARHHAASTCAISSRACSRRKQDIQTLHGVVMAIAEGRKGPARGGVLDGAQADAAARAARRAGAARVRASAARCAAWRGCCGAIRPTPSARCGRRCERPPLRRPRLQAAAPDRSRI